MRIALYSAILLMLFLLSGQNSFSSFPSENIRSPETAKNNAGTIFIISAPSGAGKSTLVSALLNEIGNLYQLERVVTYTSRAARSGEVHGKDYYFVSESEFHELVKNNFFIQWNLVYGNYYGLPMPKKDGATSYIMILDRAGALGVKSKIEKSVLIWIEVPNITTLKDRLVARGKDSPERIAHRLSTAQQEMHDEQNNPIFEHRIMNDNFKNALHFLIEIVQSKLNPKQ